MKKRVITFVIVLAVILTALPFVFTSASVDGENVAAGKSYTVTGAAANGSYLDTDSKELTDGAVAVAGNAAGCCAFSGNTGFALTVDLGTVTAGLKEFELSTTTNSDWGVKPNDSYEIFVCDTADGTFTSVGTVTKEEASVGDAVSGWVPYVYTLTLSESVSGRFVKFVATTGGNGFGYLWGSEVKVIAAEPEAPEVVIPDADKTLVSGSKSYTVTGATVNGTYGDTDGKELTDGTIQGKGDAAPVCAYAGNSGLYVTVDLGDVVPNLRQFRAHVTTNSGWSVNLPASIEIQVSDTADGTFTKAGTVSAAKAKAGEVVGGWTPYTFELSLAEGVSARFVRFIVTNSSANGYGYLWGSELEVFAVNPAVSEEESVAVSEEESVAISEEESVAVSEEESVAVSEEESEKVPDSSIADDSNSSDTPDTGDFVVVYAVIGIIALLSACVFFTRKRA